MKAVTTDRQTDMFETCLLYSLSSGFQQLNICPTLQEFGLKADGTETYYCFLSAQL